MLEIDHVAAAVEDVDATVEAFEAAGAEHVWTTVEEEFGERVAYMLAGTDMFTLLGPTGEDSVLTPFLETRGPGFHHIGVNVADLDAAVEAFEAMGGEVTMEATVDGVREEVTFDPGSWHGLEVQLIEWDDSVGPTARDHIEAMRDAHE
jgi:methylmalonyl-CoA/ethylmalonyl-CoA epimerase